jgi:hypothetical protein
MFRAQGSINNSELLDSVLPEFKKISEAPTRAEIEAEAESLGIPYEEMLKLEAQKKYKAADSSGNIYLIQNSAAWEQRVRQGEPLPWYVRPKPEFKFSAADVKRQVKTSDVIPITGKVDLAGNF